MKTFIIVIAMFLVSQPAYATEYNLGGEICPVFKCGDQEEATVWGIEEALSEMRGTQLQSGDVLLMEIIVLDYEICKKFHYSFSMTMSGAHSYSDAVAVGHCTENITAGSGCGGGGW